MKVLTSEQVAGMWAVFQACASDYIDTAFDESGIPTISQSEVIELVLDADRLKTFNPHIDWSEFDALPRKEKVRLAKTVFVHEEYL